jgi:hypothetical protein
LALISVIYNELKEIFLQKVLQVEVMRVKVKDFSDEIYQMSVELFQTRNIFIAQFNFIQILVDPLQAVYIKVLFRQHFVGNTRNSEHVKFVVSILIFFALFAIEIGPLSLFVRLIRLAKLLNQTTKPTKIDQFYLP